MRGCTARNMLDMQIGKYKTWIWYQVSWGPLHGHQTLHDYDRYIQSYCTYTHCIYIKSKVNSPSQSSGSLWLANLQLSFHIAEKILIQKIVTSKQGE